MELELVSDITEQLGIININDKLTQYKINWRGHIQIMDDNRLPQTKIKLQTWREKRYRKTTNEMGRWFPGGRNRPRGLSLIDDNIFIRSISRDKCNISFLKHLIFNVLSWIIKKEQINATRLEYGLSWILRHYWKKKI